MGDGLTPLDRFPGESTRIRRALDNLGVQTAEPSGLTVIFAGIAVKPQDPIFVDASGVGLNVGDGLAISASNVVVDLATDPGLEFSAGNLMAKVAVPILLNSSGIGLLYDDVTIGLDGSSQIEVKDASLTEAKMATALHVTNPSFGFTINHANKAVVLINKAGGSAVASASTAIVDGTVDGQELLIMLDANASLVGIPANANTDMNASWSGFKKGDWISFVWIEGGTNVWHETGRGGTNNSAGGAYSGWVGGQNNDVTSPFSATLGGTNCTASGSRAVTIAGDICTASGPFAVTIGGKLSIASGFHSVTHGPDARATLYGQVAHSTSKIAIEGDAQSTKVNASKQTTDATITKIWITGSDGTDELIIGTNRTHGYTITTIARRGNGTTIGMWIHMLVLSNNAGTTSQVGVTQQIGSVGTGSIPGPTFAADDGNGALTLNVQGIAAVINWQMRIDVVETFLAP